MKGRLLLSAFLPVVLLSCAYTVPLTREVEIEDSSVQKKPESIMIVMPQEEVDRTIRYSPQLGDTYVFQGGSALKDLLVSILEQLYRDTGHSESLAQVSGGYDIIIEPRLLSQETVISRKRGHSVDLEIEYIIRNSAGDLILRLPTSSSSRNGLTKGEQVAFLFIGAGFNISQHKKRIGSSWDVAAINSIGELLETLEGLSG